MPSFVCDGVVVVGVTGTQHRTQANERPQQAVYSSNKILFRKLNQHEDNGHSHTHTAKHTQ